MVGPALQGEAPPILWDVGMAVSSVPDQPVTHASTTQPVTHAATTVGLDDGMMFWARLADECVALSGDAVDVNVHANVGQNAGVTTTCANNDNPLGLSQSPIGPDDVEGSYTGSTTADIGPLTQPTRNGM